MVESAVLKNGCWKNGADVWLSLLVSDFCLVGSELKFHLSLLKFDFGVLSVNMPKGSGLFMGIAGISAWSVADNLPTGGGVDAEELGTGGGVDARERSECMEEEEDPELLE